MESSHHPVYVWEVIDFVSTHRQTLGRTPEEAEDFYFKYYEIQRRSIEAVHPKEIGRVIRNFRDKLKILNPYIHNFKFELIGVASARSYDEVALVELERKYEFYRRIYDRSR